MYLLSTTPGPETDFNIFYERQANEGLVHSGLMHGHRFDIAEQYNEDWATPVIAWSAGGEEAYHLQGTKTITLRSAGALIIAAGARYAYAASPEYIFRSNMISFPHWIVREAARDPLDPAHERASRLETALFFPDAQTQSLMDTIAARCAARVVDATWYAEQVALLYARLLDAQHRRAAARDALKACKRSTRAELARRVDRAQEYMLEQFHDPSLTLGEIARTACLSQFHLIRVFKTVTGATPMRRLSAIRMQAARRLTGHTQKSIKEIAAAVGYSDRTAFFKAFKAAYGVAPTAIDK
ncbi:helix-turn-helix domain-containing protein [Hyphococcus sp.]|uniref:helix-turn-helix domain-containing protein n=1 Tax=Hyphococcus sp. TaxID=2038636 RepID=UPI003CCC0AF6